MKNIILHNDFKFYSKAFWRILMFIGISFLWNALYNIYIQHHSYRGDIFRTAIKEAILPFYMWSNPFSFTIPNLIFVVTSILYISIVLRLYSNFVNQKHYTLLLSCSWLLWVLTAGYTSGFDRLTGSYAHIQTFANDMVKFNSITDLLLNYVNLQPSLDIHGQHYPPGFLILLKSMGITFSRCLIYLCGMGSILMTYTLAIKLELSPKAAFLSATLLASAPGLLIFSSIDIAPIIIMLSLMVVYFFLHMINHKSTIAIIGFVLCVSLLILFSFIISVLFLFIAIYLFYEKKVQTNKVQIINLSLCAVLIVSSFYLLYITTKFNIYSCFISSISENMKLNKSNGFDDLSRYLFRSSCNILQFIITCGFMFFFIRFKSTVVFFKSIIPTLFIAAFSGLFFCETERSWLLLLPFIAIILAQYIQTIQSKKTIIALSILISSVIELCFDHFH